MTNEDFTEMLALMIEEGYISLQEGAELYRMFLAGEIDPSELPAPPESIEYSDAEETVIAAIVLLTDIEDPEDVFEWPFAARRELMEQYLDRSDELLENLTSQNTDDIRVREWHRSVRKHIKEQTVVVSAIASREIRPDNIVTELLIVQFAFLLRFAEKLAVLKLLGSSLSVGGIISQLRLYSGKSRALFYELAEAIIPFGYIVHYHSVDLPSTCDPCHDAEENGPYLPGTGPMPGDVCLGRGNCRCWRSIEWAPERALRIRNLV